MEREHKTPLCTHPNLVPLQLVAGKRTWAEGRAYIDWTSNIINAHYLRVEEYYCPQCGAILCPPTSAPDN
jgi:acetone carboxylase gamma subunit